MVSGLASPNESPLSAVVGRHALLPPWDERPTVSRALRALLTHRGTGDSSCPGGNALVWRAMSDDVRGWGGERRVGGMVCSRTGGRRVGALEVQLWLLRT